MVDASIHEKNGEEQAHDNAMEIEQVDANEPQNPAPESVKDEANVEPMDIQPDEANVPKESVENGEPKSAEIPAASAENEKPLDVPAESEKMQGEEAAKIADEEIAQNGDAAQSTGQVAEAENKQKPEEQEIENDANLDTVEYLQKAIMPSLYKALLYVSKNRPHPNDCIKELIQALSNKNSEIAEDGEANQQKDSETQEKFKSMTTKSYLETTCVPFLQETLCEIAKLRPRNPVEKLVQLLATHETKPVDPISWTKQVKMCKMADPWKNMILCKVLNKFLICF